VNWLVSRIKHFFVTVHIRLGNHLQNLKFRMTSTFVKWSDIIVGCVYCILSCIWKFEGKRFLPESPRTQMFMSTLTNKIHMRHKAFIYFLQSHPMHSSNQFSRTTTFTLSIPKLQPHNISRALSVEKTFLYKSRLFLFCVISEWSLW
jgi:hypothetical protein